MDDLISRQAAIDAVYKCDDIFAGDMPVMVVKSDAYEALAQLPSVQPEIVRCKDCNHWSRESICDGFCSEDCMRHDEDFYCGYAERRTDG